MFDKIKFAKNFAQRKHFLREYRKTNNDKYLKTHKQIYRDIAVAINAHNELIKTKIANQKNNTYCASLNLHK